MNDQIEELAKQADPQQWHKRWFSGISPRVMDPEIQKLCKLIIEECANVVKNSKLHNMHSEPPLDWFADEILEHFGLHNEP